MSQITSFSQTSGPGSGTVTSISEGTGITLTPNPITTTGTVALTVPVVIANGGTNATTFTNTDGVVYFDGTRLVDTAVGTAGDVLTSNGAGMAPTFQATAGATISITGDSGGALVSNAFTFTGGTTNGTALFAGAGTTETLTFTDADFNTVLGLTAFKTTHTPAVGVANTGMGWGALNAVTDGSGNTAIGFNAATSLLVGINNVVLGTNSFGSATSASTNTALGISALTGLLTGSDNIAVGASAGSNYAGAESDNILIGNLGVLAESAHIRIGTNGTHTETFIAGIDGVNVGSVAKVVTMASDQLGTATITAGTNIIITPGANTITIAADTGSASFNYTPVNTSPYVVLTTDYYLSVDCSGGPITINLPNLPATGRVFVVKDRTGSAATNNITVTTVGGLVNIDGAATFVINTAYQAISLIFGGTAYEIY